MLQLRAMFAGCMWGGWTRCRRSRSDESSSLGRQEDLAALGKHKIAARMLAFNISELHKQLTKALDLATDERTESVITYLQN